MKKESLRIKLSDDIATLGGGRAYYTFTQEKFRVNQTNKKAYDAALEFNAKDGGLYLSGPTGCGKTHLACIAIRKFLDKKITIKTTTQMEISRYLRASKDAEDENERIKLLSSKNILMIDDLGVAKDTEYSISLLYEIINNRYMDNPGGLVITSNLGLNDLSKKLGDDRISSRLAAMCKIFNLAGEPDMRVKKQ